MLLGPEAEVQQRQSKREVIVGIVRRKKASALAFTRKYPRWVVLGGAILIAVGTGIRDAAKEDRSHWENYVARTLIAEAAQRAMFDVDSNSRIQLERIEQVFRHPIGIQTPSITDNQYLYDFSIMLDDGTHLAIEHNESLIKSFPRAAADLQVENDQIKKWSGISSDDQRVIDENKDRYPEVKSAAYDDSIRRLETASANRSDKVWKLHQTILDRIEADERHVNRGDTLFIWFADMLWTLGICIVVGAQWTVKPGEAPEIKL